MSLFSPFFFDSFSEGSPHTDLRRLLFFLLLPLSEFLSFLDLPLFL